MSQITPTDLSDYYQLNRPDDPKDYTYEMFVNVLHLGKYESIPLPFMMYMLGVFDAKRIEDEWNHKQPKNKTILITYPHLGDKPSETNIQYRLTSEQVASCQALQINEGDIQHFIDQVIKKLVLNLRTHKEIYTTDVKGNLITSIFHQSQMVYNHTCGIEIHHQTELNNSEGTEFFVERFIHYYTELDVQDDELQRTPLFILLKAKQENKNIQIHI